jgi:hypothetical protein
MIRIWYLTFVCGRERGTGDITLRESQPREAELGQGILEMQELILTPVRKEVSGELELSGPLFSHPEEKGFER